MKKFYIAGMGAVTPVGGNIAMTSAAVNAGISAYSASPYYTGQQPITMARVPDDIFAELQADIDEGYYYSEQHDHIIKMAIIAIKEACGYKPSVEPVPLILAMPETHAQSDGLSPQQLTRNLSTNCSPHLAVNLTRSVSTGRAAGFEAIEFAFQYLYESAFPYLLVGGSDSHSHYSRLKPLDAAKRLLTTGSPDSFAPGEAASFLLLTRHPELAQVRNGRIVGLNYPGIADESGHLFSKEPYRGDGLDLAFKAALRHHPEQSINNIYSSMNGENHWAKEYGVAYLRNKKYFKEPFQIKHPADCYGDLGSATATTLIVLAAEQLFKTNRAEKHLVYGSSDGARRGAIVVENVVVSRRNT